MCLRTSKEVMSNAPTVAEIKMSTKNINEVKDKLMDLVDFCLNDYETTGNENMLEATRRIYETIKLLEDI